MKRFVASLVSLLTLVGAAVVPAVAPAAPSACDGLLCAGAARADITPPVGTPLWGYSARAFYAQPERYIEQRSHWIDTDLYAKALFLRSEGVHTRLYARAIVLQNTAGTKMALVQTDLGAVTGEVHTAVAKAVASLGIRRDFLLISATHTHGGPGAVQQAPAHGLLVGDTFDPRAFKRVVDGVTRAVVEANARLESARIGIGQGRILDASVSRSMRAHAEGFQNHPNPCPDPEALETDPCQHPGEFASDPHAIDPDVTVIRVDTAAGVPLGVWTDFAAHGTMVFGDDLIFSGDNQGIAARLIERGIEERARAAGVDMPDGWEIVVAYANGTEGDIAPAGAGKHRFMRMEDSGRRQAVGVLAVYDQLGNEMLDDVALDARWDWLYMNGEGGTSPVPILGAGADCPFGTSPFPSEGIPGQGRKCPFLVLAGTGPHWAALQVLRIGDLLVGSVPGEMSVQMGRRVKKRLIASAPEGTIPIIAGLANDYFAYVVTPEEYDVQDYEGTFTLWGREQGPLVRDRLGTLADRLFAGQPNPAFTEPPDTSWIQMENVAPLSEAAAGLGQRRPPGSVIAEAPETARRGKVESFAWVGGPPSVEMQPDVPFVETQRLVDGRWETAFWDEGFEDILDYWREGLEDRWGTQWDVPLDATAGRYRFVVRGMGYEGSSLTPYEIVSREFQVEPSHDLTIASVEPSPDGLRIVALYPEAAGSDHPNFGEPPPYIHQCSAARGTAACNFRWRAAGPTAPTATASIRIDGDTIVVTGTYTGATGTYVFPTVVGSDVEVLSFVDAYGNEGSR